MTDVADGFNDVTRLLRSNPDVVLLDAGTDRDAARALCEQIRLSSPVRIVVVSTQEDAADLVDFLDAGADDYLPRADRVRELVARVRAVLRRREPAGVSVVEEVLTVGGVKLDVTRHEVEVDGDRVHLPLKQFQLLELLLANPGRVLSRRTILERVWGDTGNIDGSTLEVQIKRLRQKVELEPSQPERIRTVRGIGYMYAPEPARPQSAGVPTRDG